MRSQSPHRSASKRWERSVRPGVYRNAVKLLIIFSIFSLWPSFASAQEPTTIEPGQSIKRELAAGQEHSYRIKLTADQFLKAVVVQKGIDVVVQALGPDGKQILEFDSERSLRGEERISLAAEGAGEYRLKVTPEQQRGVAGSYEIRIEELRPATEAERVLHEMRKLHNRANELRDAGKYEEALPIYQQVVATRRAISGPDDRELAATLHDLAVFYYYKGDYPAVEPLSSQALAIQEKTLGPDHPEVASSLNLLSNISFNKGDLTRAEQLSERALSIKEKSVGLENNTLSPYLNNLARVYERRGDSAKAESLYRRALAVRENSLGPEHPLIAQSLNGLANFSYNKGDDLEAERLHLRALKMREQLLGPDHPSVAESLGNLANIYRKRKDYARAEPFYRRALAIQEKKLGPQRPHIARLLNNLAQFYALKGDISQAIECQARANTVTEYNLALNLASGSERQKLAFLAIFKNQTDFTLSLNAQAAPADPEAIELAFTTLLRRKSRGLDAMTDTIGTLRRHATPEDQNLFDRLAEARSRLASIKLKRPEDSDSESELAPSQPLEEAVEKLEAELSARSAGFRAQTQPVTLAAVQGALPADSVLVEFVVYTPQEIQTLKSQSPRYLAYLLKPRGSPGWVDLGEAAPIDQLVEDWRQSLRGNRIDVKRLARELDEKILRPVRAAFPPGTSHLLIAPDGSLNLVPFAALVDEENRYLIESFTISYLTSGRDLLRLQGSPPSQEAPLIMADPLFDRAASIIAQARAVSLTAERRAKGQSETAGQTIFRPLPGTRAEALAIKAILPDAVLLLQQDATEAALKRARAPRLLHIATHGFFQGDQHSGLALSGANQGQGGDDDGVLTALEMAGLDLWGTKLVVLSACDTGLFEVRKGEGVQGLRRALVLAGSESQVMSLWPVTDEGAKEFMIDYYRALQRGEGRSEGLRQVQLRMLHGKERRHPFYWAAFIQSGEWANLEGKR